ncbi:MAG: exodeoxyribonuclease VII large subunit [Candidatus Zambryskibacteria bacterium]|nr:exodeoxyribonuclease VII large subunit [Candidatus Zambryskibacteria bacterium]
MQDSSMSLDIVFSVSEYLDSLNRSLKQVRARIVGEVLGIQEYPGRSYMYFSIKDPKDGSTAKCFMWKQDYKNSRVNIEEGMEVVLTAYPNVYKPNGGMTLQVEEIELVGEGALKIAYEKLKTQLEKEGLFDEVNKKALPALPHRIGVITSKSGAVISDFLSNIGKYGFEIIFVDSKVEGEGAVKDLLSALRTLYIQKVDILVLMRGGGSLESFQAFNNESVVRAVSKFNAPVITGIGHDKDAPLVSFVSDKNVSTPTAVANLLNAGWKEAEHEVELAEQKIVGRFEKVLHEQNFLLSNAERIIEQRFRIVFETFRMYQESLSRSFDRIGIAIERMKDSIVESERRILREFTEGLEKKKDVLGQFEKLLTGLNPERQLRLGWSITKNKAGVVVRSVSQVKSGEELEVSLADGSLNVKIK